MWWVILSSARQSQVHQFWGLAGVAGLRYHKWGVPLIGTNSELDFAEQLQ
jgi:hypothetical protein